MSKIPSNPPSVGKTINKLRKERQMTLDQLASVSGVSKSMLSQIERDETNPTLATIWRLAEALGQTIDSLLRHGEQGSQMSVISESAHPLMHGQDGSYTAKVLGPASLANEIEWYELTIQPGGSLISDPHSERTVEHLTVLQGAVEVVSADNVSPLTKGETARYAADVHHEIHNRTDQVAVVLLVDMLGRDAV
ncbi:helix-turn-helix domain-containing protein [Aestuariispira insulae]|uniref:XRE family transcriptional regulator n=1 Tax=Aestuariispira insulae TaxID=1461337 RepID=A0A3D9HXL8_9PROT|nr:XRE family transcriptional regulator [Aestuariispira insulae]RED54252.1 XRE family transcriptional regulator [Aestuariispira insulae]